EERARVTLQRADHAAFVSRAGPQQSIDGRLEQRSARIVRITQLDRSSVKPIIEVGWNTEVAADLTMRDGSDCVAPDAIDVQRRAILSADGQRLDGRDIVSFHAGLALDLLRELDEGFACFHPGGGPFICMAVWAVLHVVRLARNEVHVVSR